MRRLLLFLAAVILATPGQAQFFGGGASLKPQGNPGDVQTKGPDGKFSPAPINCTGTNCTVVRTLLLVSCGGSDDTTAIATAITSAGSGATVQLGGTLCISTGNTIATAGITFTIPGGTTLQHKSASSGRLLTITASNVVVNGTGTIDCNKANQTGTTGRECVYVNAAGASQTLTGAQVRNVTIQNGVNACLEFAQTGAGASNTKGLIDGVTVHDCGTSTNTGAIAEGIALYGASDITVSNNHVSGTANHNYLSTIGSNNRFIGNAGLNAGDASHFAAGFSHCIAIDGNEGLNPNAGHIVDSNYCENSRSHSIELADRVDKSSITNNVVNGTTAAGGEYGGIYFGGALGYSEYCTISGNQVYDVTGSGIIVEGPSSSSRSAHCSVANNVVLNSTQHGIYIHNADEGTITGNVVMNSSRGNSGTYDGINLSVYNRWTISDNRSADNQGTPTQRYGINLTATPNNNTAVVGNLVEPNKTGAINMPSSNGATGIVATKNVGYNPTNSTYTPAVPASGSLVTNNTGTDQTVCFTANSNGTTQWIGGSSGAHSVGVWNTGQGHCFPLPVGQTAGFSYSGSSPSWQWIGM